MPGNKRRTATSLNVFRKHQIGQRPDSLIASKVNKSESKGTNRRMWGKGGDDTSVADPNPEADRKSPFLAVVTAVSTSECCDVIECSHQVVWTQNDFTGRLASSPPLYEGQLPECLHIN